MLLHVRYESNQETLPATVPVTSSDSDSDPKDQIPCKAKLPRKPTPYILYHHSRMKDLVAQGKTLDETFKICTQCYFDMHDDEKLNWILLALNQRPAYLASYLLLLFYLLP